MTDPRPAPMGELPDDARLTDQGRLTPRPLHPGEGYAVIRCGGTEVVVSYTLLHALDIELASASPFWGSLVALRRALNAITCEASLGRTGDADLRS
jgi:hypothetical protein